MSFVGTWRASVNSTFPPAGTDHSVDTLDIPADPTPGAQLLLSRQDLIFFSPPGPGGPCGAAISSTFRLVVKSVTPNSFVCSVFFTGCSVSGATCGISCGDPGPTIPEVTFTLTQPNTMTGVGFASPEVFQKVAGLMAEQVAWTKKIDPWTRKLS